MMKLLKRLFLIVVSILLALIIFLIVVLLIDTNKTSYLEVENHPSLLKNSYLITNVNVVPMTRDTILMQKMVLIEEGRIKAIKDHIEKNDIDRIEGEGKYLLPGLNDMHVHVWDEFELGLYLSYGVTGLRNLWGMPMHLRMKEAINSNEIIAPNFYTSGPKLTGPEFMGDDNLNLHSVSEAKQKVKSYHDRGYDFIKTYYGLTPELFDAVIEESMTLNMDIVSHPSPKVAYDYHLQTQIKSIEHTEDIIQQPLDYQLDSIKLLEVIDELASVDHNSFSPTLMSYYNIYRFLTEDDVLSTDRVNYMNSMIKKIDSKGQFDRWQGTKAQDPGITDHIKSQHEFHLMIINKLQEAGVRIISSTDSGIGITVPGLSLHEEFAFYKEAGLSNFEVLQTSTIHAAQTHELMNDLGTIEEGKVANLLLVESNPLEDLTTLERPTKVFVKGRMLDRPLLDSFAGHAHDRSNLIASAWRYLEFLWVEK